MHVEELVWRLQTNSTPCKDSLWTFSNPFSAKLFNKWMIYCVCFVFQHFCSLVLKQIAFLTRLTGETCIFSFLFIFEYTASKLIIICRHFKYTSLFAHTCIMLPIKMFSWISKISLESVMGKLFDKDWVILWIHTNLRVYTAIFLHHVDLSRSSFEWSYNCKAFKVIKMESILSTAFAEHWKIQHCM